MMIKHHTGAVDMTKVEIKYGQDKEMKKMAQKILVSQPKEIMQMQDWQKRHQ